VTPLNGFFRLIHGVYLSSTRVQRPELSSRQFCRYSTGNVFDSMKKAAGSKAAEVRGQRPEEQAEHKHLHLKTFTVMTSWSKRVTRHELMKIYAFLFVETPYLVRCR